MAATVSRWSIGWAIGRALRGRIEPGQSSAADAHPLYGLIWAELARGGSTLGLTQRYSIDGFAIFERIFVAAQKSEAQFQSVLLHELGHVLGLGHSCAFENEEGGPALCDDLPSPHPYREAVLFPYLVNREKKEALRENDRVRAVCALEKSVIRSPAE